MDRIADERSESGGAACCAVPEFLPDRSDDRAEFVDREEFVPPRDRLRPERPRPRAGWSSMGARATASPVRSSWMRESSAKIASKPGRSMGSSAQQASMRSPQGQFAGVGGRMPSLATREMIWAAERAA